MSVRVPASVFFFSVCNRGRRGKGWTNTNTKKTKRRKKIPSFRDSSWWKCPNAFGFAIKMPSFLESVNSFIVQFANYKAENLLHSAVRDLGSMSNRMLEVWKTSNKVCWGVKVFIFKDFFFFFLLVLYLLTERKASSQRLSKYATGNIT